MKRQSGFVMADAIVALMIGALLLGGLLSANTMLARSGNMAENKLLATYLARELILDTDAPDTGQRTISGTAFAWSIEDTPAARLANGSVMAIDRAATVSWTSRGGVQSVTLIGSSLEAGRV